MSNEVSVRWYCPGCEPDVDPIAEVVEARLCDRHRIQVEHYISVCDTDGASNKVWCDFFHAGRNGR